VIDEYLDIIETKYHGGKRKKKEQKKKYIHNHKHEYMDCLVLFGTNSNKYGIYIKKAQICTICGKINHYIFFESEPIQKKNLTLYKLLSPKEVLEKYENLPIYDEDGNLQSRSSANSIIK
jgi:hypothetical protein